MKKTQHQAPTRQRHYVIREEADSSEFSLLHDNDQGNLPLEGSLTNSTRTEDYL